MVMIILFEILIFLDPEFQNGYESKYCWPLWSDVQDKLKKNCHATCCQDWSQFLYHNLYFFAVYEYHTPDMKEQLISSLFLPSSNIQAVIK